RRMPCKVLPEVAKYHPKVAVGGFSDDLGVHEIPYPHKDPSRSHGDDDSIENPQNRFIEHVFPVKVHRHNNSNGSTMAGKPPEASEFELRFKAHGQEDLEQVVLKIIPVVKKDVSQAGSHQGCDHGINKEGIQFFKRNIFAVKDAF